MRELTVNPSEIHPVQQVIRLDALRRYVPKIVNEGYTPIPGIELDGKIVIGDGHHTSSGLFLLSNQIHVNVFETDREVRDCKKGCFCNYLSMDQVTNGFRDHLDDLSCFGIYEIGDIYVYPGNVSEKELKRLKQLSLRELLEGYQSPN